MCICAYVLLFLFLWRTLTNTPLCPCSPLLVLPGAAKAIITHNQSVLSRHIGKQPTNPKDIFLIPKKAEQTRGRGLLKSIFPLEESSVLLLLVHL